MNILSMVSTNDPVSEEPEGELYNEMVVELGGERFKIKGHPFCFFGLSDENAVKRAEFYAKKKLNEAKNPKAE